MPFRVTYGMKYSRCVLKVTYRNDYSHDIFRISFIKKSSAGKNELPFQHHNFNKVYIIR